MHDKPHCEKVHYSHFFFFLVMHVFSAQLIPIFNFVYISTKFVSSVLLYQQIQYVMNMIYLCFIFQVFEYNVAVLSMCMYVMYLKTVFEI